MALLALAAHALPGRVEAATVDHGLRPESGAEAELVARACMAMGVPHRILPVRVERGNLQAGARAARYGALGQWMDERDLAAIATAHHADDQAETLLMRLNRGSGVAGLAGIRAHGRVPGSGRVLLRPLLGWRRAELREVIDATGLAVADDSSNSDDRFDRVRLRKALAATLFLDIPALADSAAHLADADMALDWAAQREWIDGVARNADGARYAPQAPRAIVLRVLARLVSELGNAPPPRGGAVARMHDALARGEAVTLGGVAAQARDGAWHFRREPPRRGAG